MNYLIQFIFTITVSTIIAALLSVAVLDNVNAQLQDLINALQSAGTPSSDYI